MCAVGCVSNCLAPARAMCWHQADDVAKGEPDDIAKAREDALDDHYVPTELINEWISREDKVWISSCDNFVQLPTKVRHLAAKFMAEAVETLDLLPSSWFLAVTLLDAYSLRAPGGLEVKNLAAVCVVIVKLLHKMDVADCRWNVEAMITCIASKAVLFAHCLQTLGYDAIHVSADTIVVQERILLTTFQWKISMTSHEMWISMFCERFHVLTGTALQPSVKWIQEQSIFFASRLLMWQATSERLLPRRVVCGLIGLNMVRARLLPLQALQPPTLCLQQWEGLLSVS